MKDSDKRIQFIAGYISAYEEKIKLLNANGLFDSAKLFELFAIEVGSLYIGQRLRNLNVDTYTYPCVDLITADKQTYIQVSTAKNIPAKIKTRAWLPMSLCSGLATITSLITGFPLAFTFALRASIIRA